jgi:hypothetical protein
VLLNTCQNIWWTDYFGLAVLAGIVKHMPRYVLDWLFQTSRKYFGMAVSVGIPKHMQSYVMDWLLKNFIKIWWTGCFRRGY